MKYILLLLISINCFSKDVLISFDGSCTLSMWEETLNYAKENNVKFTYFISAPYFLTQKDVEINPYWAEKEIGSAPIRFRKDTEEEKSFITRRFDYLNRAILEGHEIGSHFVGHYTRGDKFTYEQWGKEIVFFNQAISKGFNLNNITGVRAPCLAVNEHYYKAIEDFGYQYDTSTTNKHKPFNFKKLIPIRQIKILSPFREIIGKGSCIPFDYNFHELVLKTETNVIISMLGNVTQYNRVLIDEEEMFFDALCYDYLNNPEPTQVCLHFYKIEEGDPYWVATKRFIEWSKDKNPNYIRYKEVK